MSHASLVVAVEGPHSEIEKQIAWEMEPFDENGEFFADGSRWDWYVIGGRSSGLLGGNIVQKTSALLGQCKLVRAKWAKESWDSLQDYQRKHGEPHPFAEDEGLEPNDTESNFIERLSKFGLAACVFLKNRHWHEAERLGWFGTGTYTECELKDRDKPVADPKAWFGKCLYKMDEKNARIICWNEPWEIWSQEYYQRFIEPLPDGQWLAVVDYHV